jgi:hypothetical protein
VEVTSPKNVSSHFHKKVTRHRPPPLPSNKIHEYQAYLFLTCRYLTDVTEYRRYRTDIKTSGPKMSTPDPTLQP